MSERWRNHYDSWKLASGNTRYEQDEEAYTAYIEADADGLPFDEWLAQLDAQAEDAAEAQAERQREDAMFDRDDREDDRP